jgi:hypothetical protein
MMSIAPIIDWKPGDIVCYESADAHMKQMGFVIAIDSINDGDYWENIVWVFWGDLFYDNRLCPNQLAHRILWTHPETLQTSNISRT